MNTLLMILFVFFVIAGFMTFTAPACDPGYVPALSSPNFWACVMAQPRHP